MRVVEDCKRVSFFLPAALLVSVSRHISCLRPCFLRRRAYIFQDLNLGCGLFGAPAVVFGV